MPHACTRIVRPGDELRPFFFTRKSSVVCKVRRVCACFPSSAAACGATRCVQVCCAMVRLYFGHARFYDAREAVDFAGRARRHFANETFCWDVWPKCHCMGNACGSLRLWAWNHTLVVVVGCPCASVFIFCSGGWQHHSHAYNLPGRAAQSLPTGVCRWPA